jgi:hypothetical protein
MKASTLIALVFIVLLIGFYLRAKYEKTRQFKTAGEFAQWLATEAVKDAQENNHVSLDYAPESIQKVEQILGNLHDKYVKDHASISANGLGSAYGAYVGEVIRRSESGAKWERDDPVGGEKSYPIIWGSGRSYPMAWCYHRIVNGPEDNIWVKYRVLKQKRDEAKSSPPN